jgi:hypothetical protein
MGPVSGAESVIDVDIRQLCQLPGERRVVLLFPDMKA